MVATVLGLVFWRLRLATRDAPYSGTTEVGLDAFAVARELGVHVATVAHGEPAATRMTTLITVSRTEVRVDGNAALALPAERQRQVSEGIGLENSAEPSRFAGELAAASSQRAEENRGARLIVDAATPYRVLIDVLAPLRILGQEPLYYVVRDGEREASLVERRHSNQEKLETEALRMNLETDLLEAGARLDESYWRAPVPHERLPSLSVVDREGRWLVQVAGHSLLGDCSASATLGSAADEVVVGDVAEIARCMENARRWLPRLHKVTEVEIQPAPTTEFQVLVSMMSQLTTELGFRAAVLGSISPALERRTPLLDHGSGAAPPNATESSLVFGDAVLRRGRVSRVNNVIAGARKSVANCQRMALGREQSSRGAVYFRLEVAADGAVVGSSITSAGPLGSTAATCVKRSVEGLTFDAPETEGAEVVGKFYFVTYPERK